MAGRLRRHVVNITGRATYAFSRDMTIEALFFVWNLATSDESRPGIFSPRRDLGGAVSAPGTNVFAIKVNYWLTP